MIEGNAMVSDDAKVSEIFNEFFGSAVKSLNIPPYEPIQDYRTQSDDHILNIIGKYKDHPSILKINEVTPRESLFSFKLTDIATVMREISNLTVAKSCPIDSSSIFGPIIVIIVLKMEYFLITKNAQI